MQDRGRESSFLLPSPDKITEKKASALQTPCNTSKNLQAPCLFRIPPPLQSVEAPSPTNHSDPKSWDAELLHSASPRDIVSHSFVDCDGPRSQLDGSSNPIYWTAVARVCTDDRRKLRSISAWSIYTRLPTMFQRPSLTQTFVRLIACQTGGRRDRILSKPTAIVWCHAHVTLS
jgi:hypothetical protein